MEDVCTKNKNSLTRSQFICILFGALLQTDILSIPNDIVKICHQDAWIAVVIGTIYPLYIVVLTASISKKFPNDNILTLSKKFLGKFIGNILNLIFLTYFIYYSAYVANYYMNLTRGFVVGFLTPLKMAMIIFLIAIYTLSKGLKTIGKINEILFYVAIILVLSAIPALKVSNLNNLKPMLGSSFKEIISAGINSIYFYTGIEIILLIYPFNKEKNKIMSSSIIAIFITSIIYVWVIFITTYYLGPDIVTKSYWSFLLVTQSVTISVINNYRYIFIFLWSLIAFKLCALFYYSSAFILKETIRKAKNKRICIFLYPLMIYITLKLGNITLRENLSYFIMKIYVVFNIVYVTLIAIIVHFKKGGIN